MNKDDSPYIEAIQEADMLIRWWWRYCFPIAAYCFIMIVYRLWVQREKLFQLLGF